MKGMRYLFIYKIKPLLVLGILAFLVYRTKTKKKTDIISLLLLILLVFIGSYKEKITNPYMIFINPYVLLATAFLLYKVFIGFHIKARNKFYEIDANTDLITLNREIHVDYSPSTVGYLFNQKLELKDLSADIMNLFAQKIIDIRKNESKKYEIILKEQYYKNIVSPSDKYILDNLTDAKDTFNFKEWESLVKEDYHSRSFSSPKKAINNKIFFIPIFIIILLGICIWGLLGLIVSIEVSLVYWAFLYARTMSKSNIDIHLSKTGQEELKKWLKFKKFITEYTLIKDRTVSEITLFEKYIPYAVSLRYQ